MKLHKRHAIPLVALVAALAAGSYAIAGGGSGKFDESLSGYQEDPPTISTTGNGTFKANLSRDGTEISYRLSYAGLEGDVTQAHIHFGGAAAERRHLRLPVHQPRQRAGGHASVSRRAGDDDRERSALPT